MPSTPIPWFCTRLALDALVALGPVGHTPTFDADDLPDHTAAVPDLLRLAGLTTVTIPGAPCCRWIGQGGAEVALNQPTASAPIHRGHLAVRRTTPPAIAITQTGWPARLADAAALLGAATPALADGKDGAWNPLPWRRHALVGMPFHAPIGTAPRDTPLPGALRDGQGARHAVAADPLPTGLVLTTLALDGGAASTLEPATAAVTDVRWDASATTLDQGRVRAEITSDGRISRLCWDGVFAALAQPWPLVVPGAMDRPDPGADAGAYADSSADAADARPHLSTISGMPLLAILRYRLATAQGTVDVAVHLRAHDDAITIIATWNGAGPLTLRHPTRHNGARLECGDECSRWTLPQTASALAAQTRVHGLRHAALAAGDGRGLCLAFDRPTTVVAWDGDMRIEIAPGETVHYALLAAHRPVDACTRLQTALGLGTGHNAAFAPHHSLPTRQPIRTVLPPGVEALWWRAASDWDGEILIVEQIQARQRTYLFAPNGRSPARAVRVDAHGTVIDDLDPTPEGDGWILDLDPGAIALVRWRFA